MTEQKQTNEQNFESAAKPDCFPNAEEWGVYQWLWVLSQRWSTVDYCRDCTPEYRDKMVSEGRCKYPETVFVIEHGEMVGVSGRRWVEWMSAITGRRGNIVSPPSRQARDRYVEYSTLGDPQRQAAYNSAGPAIRKAIAGNQKPILVELPDGAERKRKTYPKFTDADRSEAVAMFHELLPSYKNRREALEVVAARFGCSAEAIRQWAAAKKVA
jgi:hypothetical protein